MKEKPNKSLDVRQKQLLFKTCLFNPELRVFGFCPRQLGRSAACARLGCVPQVKEDRLTKQYARQI